MCDQEMAFSTRALVLTKVTGGLLRIPVPPASNLKHLVGFKLADPKFNSPGIGADIFGKLMEQGESHFKSPGFEHRSSQ
jgi:hypothetical protein